MVMSTPSRLLQMLEPPPGGWQRLLRRRDAESFWPMPLAALASAVVAVLIAFPRAPPAHPIELQLNGARLMSERSEGETLRMLDDRKTVALPSSDPNVRVYWIEPGHPAAQRATP
jgi:hypothetical protein